MTTKKIILATALSIALILPVVQGIVSYVQAGIEHGASIRVSKATTCSETSEPSFGGCSSIL